MNGTLPKIGKLVPQPTRVHAAPDQTCRGTMKTQVSCFACSRNEGAEQARTNSRFIFGAPARPSPSPCCSVAFWCGRSDGRCPPHAKLCEHGPQRWTSGYCATCQPPHLAFACRHGVHEKATPHWFRQAAKHRCPNLCLPPGPSCCARARPPILQSPTLS